MSTRFTIRPLAQSDRSDWERLFAEYATFYHTEVPPGGYDEVWSWIFDPNNDFWCDVMVSEDVEVIGFVQYQMMHNALRGAMSCYLSDMFIVPEARRHGGGRAFIDHVLAFARDKGLKSVRWLTQEQNDAARRLYDQYAPKTDFVFYSVRANRPD